MVSSRAFAPRLTGCANDSVDEQLLGKNHVGAITGAKVADGACADAAGEGLITGYNPGIVLGKRHALAQIFEESWVGRRRLAPIVQALPISGKDAGDGVVMRCCAVVTYEGVEHALRK